MCKHVVAGIVYCILGSSLILGLPALAHEGHDHDVPSAVWPDHDANEPLLQAASLTFLDPVITAWKQADGTTGSSTNPAIHSVVSAILADVNTIAYDNDYVYLRTSGIPSHSVGPFGDGNPSVPGDLDATYRITRNPSPETGTRTSAAYSLGNIGVLANGVGIYGPWDATFWDPRTETLTNPGAQQPPNGSQWNTNALWRRADGMDEARGHPSPLNNQTNPDGSVKGRYHYHMLPEDLIEQLDPGNNGTKGSPIIGYAYDGYAIVGPYAYEEQGDGSLAAVQMTSSYGLIAERTSIGTTPGGNPSPFPDEAEYARGSFIEDFEYKPGTGTLNAFNMAFVKFDEAGRAVLTDESDEDGEWAYFFTIDAIAATTGNDTTRDGDVAYPYIIGPEFYGVYDPTPNQFNVPDNVTFFFAYGEPLPGDTDGDGDIDDADLGTSFSNYTGPLTPGAGGKTREDGDTDGDGDVDDADLATLFSSYTGALNSTSIPLPEPVASVMIAMFGLMIAGQRRSYR